MYLDSTTCQSRSGAVMSISSVPLLRSSANKRIVSSGGMTANTNQNHLSANIVCIGHRVPSGPAAVNNSHV